MIANSSLPHVLAVINAATIPVLLVGYSRIRGGGRDAHRRTMLIAGALGLAFLAIYFYYHASAGLAKFGGVGPVRVFYFSLLAIHILMAVVVAIAVPLAVFYALKRRFDSHRRLARWALPLWLFVSASGLLVYLMAVHLFPFNAS
jgi:putative membrane protein